jgi:hypothetical protein
MTMHGVINRRSYDGKCQVTINPAQPPLKFQKQVRPLKTPPAPIMTVT